MLWDDWGSYFIYLWSFTSWRRVTITVCPSSLSNIYEKYILEGMTLSCKDDGKGYLSVDNYDEIMEKIEWADSLVIGPGLGLEKDTVNLVTKLVDTVDKPIVLDADGLASFNNLNGPKANLIITPHLGEFSKILNIDKMILLNDFIQIVKKFLADFAGVAVIKHVPACIISGQKMSLNSTGNPGLATAGSGDVLSGVIASFISQNMDSYDACRLSSYFHGLAADNQIKYKGIRGLIASDLPLEIAKVINEYETYNYLVILFFLTIILGSSIPGKNIPSSYIFSKDKLLHIIEYFILGFLLFNSLLVKHNFQVYYVLFLGASFAAMDEIYQSTVIGRFSSSFDVIADFIGLTLSILSNKIFTKKLS